MARRLKHTGRGLELADEESISEEGKKELALGYGRSLYETEQYEAAIEVLKPYLGKEADADTFSRLSLKKLKP